MPICPDGSPAHAGIDPIIRLPGRSTGRLPRTRGDRPLARDDSQLLCAAPPHTRGSTHPEVHDRTARRGSPAHAGIDPARWGVYGGAGRLPRTRGDRPVARRISAPRHEAPPHTRGSTPSSACPADRLGGSPAHAGIDLRIIQHAHLPGRLPRTRGDRPILTWTRFWKIMAPPHTRGSTRDRDLLLRRSLGSPAHAGIDPSPTSVGRVYHRILFPGGRGVSSRRLDGVRCCIGCQGVSAVGVLNGSPLW